MEGGGAFDLGILPLDSDSEAQPLLDNPSYEELHAAVSPGGRWLAYTSDESGRREVYVRPFPEVDSGRWQVSTDGGEAPLWSPDGFFLYYRVQSARHHLMMSVAVAADSSSFERATPSLLFSGNHLFGSSGRNYDISHDGKRFLMVKRAEAPESAEARIVVVRNWVEELKRLVPTD